MLSGLVEGKLIEPLRVGYDAAKGGLMTPLLYLKGKGLGNIIQPGNMDSQLMRGIEALPQFDRAMDSLT